MARSVKFLELAGAGGERKGLAHCSPTALSFSETKQEGSICRIKHLFHKVLHLGRHGQADLSNATAQGVTVRCQAVRTKCGHV